MQTFIPHWVRLNNKVEIMEKATAITLLECLIQDLIALRDGEWVPDEDSCEASIEVAQAVLNHLTEDN